MNGKLVVLSGPSGVGKDTVFDAWASQDPRVVRVVSATTRAPREGEQEGEDYWFLSKGEFERRRRTGAFLEAKNVHGEQYATPKADVECLLAQGKVTVLKIDVQGGLAVREIYPNALLVFLAPPSMEELEQRLRKRATNTEADIERRLRNAAREMEMSHEYDAVVVNDKVDRAVEEIMRLTSG
ncbi:MAG: guanylate kinase [Fimbriimonadaceae bacterium]|nr:guanylate kinase [Fimbriimonadaceae bacterium]